MIRRCDHDDFDQIWTIVNDGAQAYKGVIPADCCAEPYMSREELQHELDAGVVFCCYEQAEAAGLLGVMGLQQVGDVTLIRHAYVRGSSQKLGIGGQLLSHLRTLTERPILIGAWADATWAIRFYEKHGFQVISPDEKEILLRKYWEISERQIKTSVVLVDAKWRQIADRRGSQINA